MADTKISALTAAGSVADANEFAINEAGASKKATAAQIKTHGNTAPVFAAGTSSANTHPKLTSGTKLTTPETGALEYANGTIYATPAADCRGTVKVEYWIRQAASRTLTSSTTEQKLFDSVTNGTLDLPTGVYFFSSIFYVTGLSGTSGNLAFDIIGAGSAVLADILFHASGLDAGTLTNAATRTGSFTITRQSVASIVTAGTGTGLAVDIQGTFEITTAGTIIPSVTLVTAAAGTVAAGSFFKCNRVGDINTVSEGKWT